MDTSKPIYPDYKQTGFTLFEISIALIIAAVVAFFGLQAFLRSADISSGELKARQISQLRDAYENYLNTYRNNFVNNTAIVSPTGTTIPVTTSVVATGSANNTTCAPAASVRCPSIQQLIDLRLLPTGFPTNTMAMCGYNDVGTAPTVNSAPYCGQLENRCTATTPQICSVKGFVAFTNALPNGNVVQGAIDSLKGLAVFSRAPGENLRGAGGSFFVPNPVSGTPAPANVLGATFAVFTGATNQVAGVDFCPADAATTYTANSPTSANILLSTGKSYPNGATFAAGSNCSATSTGTFAYGNVPVNSSVTGVGSNAGRPISAIINCSSVGGVATPNYVITECGAPVAGVDFCPSQIIPNSRLDEFFANNSPCVKNNATALTGDIGLNETGLAQVSAQGNNTGFYSTTCQKKPGGGLELVLQFSGAC